MSAIVAIVVAGANAHAHEIEHAAATCESKATYEGGAPDGAVIRLTIPDLKVETFARVSPPSRASHIASPHWSSFIGTGRASEAAHNP